MVVLLRSAVISEVIDLVEAKRMTQVNRFTEGLPLPVSPRRFARKSRPGFWVGTLS
jgi:hypothetical protein